MSHSNWVSVCEESDLLRNMGVCAKVGNKQVAIFLVENADGQRKLFALDNHCPFSDANVLSRGIVGDLKNRLVVASPIYKQHFDLQTGECLEDEVSIPTYAVRSINGKVEVAA